MSTREATATIIGNLSSFVRDNSFTKVSRIKHNTNGYAYVSFLDNDGNWEHVYLSKNMAKKVSEGSEPQVLKGCIVNRCTYDNGEERLKICSPAENGMLEVSADMF